MNPDTERRYLLNGILDIHALMEGGVEHSDLGDAAHNGLAGVDTGDVGGVVQGGKRDAGRDIVHENRPRPPTGKGHGRICIARAWQGSEAACVRFRRERAGVPDQAGI